MNTETQCLCNIFLLIIIGEKLNYKHEVSPMVQDSQVVQHTITRKGIIAGVTEQVHLPKHTVNKPAGAHKHTKAESSCPFNGKLFPLRKMYFYKRPPELHVHPIEALVTDITKVSERSVKY